jgi:hypothetical protein
MAGINECRSLILDSLIYKTLQARRWFDPVHLFAAIHAHLRGIESVASL